jgi:hypothetical protein
MDMSTKPKSVAAPAVVPVNDETRAMLNYAASPESRAKIERARQELREGEGISVTDGYFDKLNQRIDDRAKKSRPSRP